MVTVFQCGVTQQQNILKLYKQSNFKIRDINNTVFLEVRTKIIYIVVLVTVGTSSFKT